MRVKQQSGNVLILIIAILVAVLIVGILAWLFLANVIVGGQIYPKSAQYLNLREKELTLEEYDTLARKLPDSEIYWSIPFQGKTYPENTVVLNVTELSDEDLDTIGYFRYLEVVNAKDCRDYAQLQALQDRYPDVTVAYAVYINDVPYELEAAQVTLTALTEQEIETLQYLPKLTSVDMGSCSDYTLLDKLMQTYPDLSITVKLGQDTYTSDTTELTVTGMTDAEAKSLAFFSGLTKLHLVDPVMDAQTLLGLQQTYPNAQITWEVDVLGVKLRSDATELDLMSAISEAGVKAYAYAATDIVTGNRDERVMIFAKRNSYPIEDLTDKTAELISQVESAMAYFPNVKKVNMCGAFLDNEAMAAFREAHREDYKVVWTVDCGTMAASTDTTYFMPYKYNVAYFFDENTVNLRYCEEVVAVDLGHMSVHNADFVQYMPNLKYLILAHTR